MTNIRISFELNDETNELSIRIIPHEVPQPDVTLGFHVLGHVVLPLTQLKTELQAQNTQDVKAHVILSPWEFYPLNDEDCTMLCDAIKQGIPKIHGLHLSAIRDQQAAQLLQHLDNNIFELDVDFIAPQFTTPNWYLTLEQIAKFSNTRELCLEGLQELETEHFRNGTAQANIISQQTLKTMLGALHALQSHGNLQELTILGSSTSASAWLPIANEIKQFSSLKNATFDVQVWENGATNYVLLPDYVLNSVQLWPRINRAFQSVCKGSTPFKFELSIEQFVHLVEELRGHVDCLSILFWNTDPTIFAIPAIAACERLQAGSSNEIEMLVAEGSQDQETESITHSTPKETYAGSDEV